MRRKGLRIGTGVKEREGWEAGERIWGRESAEGGERIRKEGGTRLGYLSRGPCS